MTPLSSQQELRVKLAAPGDGGDTDGANTDGGDVVIYLSASDAGDGNEHDFALWENARIVSEGRPDLPLKDVRVTPADGAEFRYGLDSALFGKHPDSGDGDVATNSLCVRAPSLIEVRLPASLVDGAEFVVEGRLPGMELSGTEPHGEESSGEDWQRVDGLRARGRGGMLGFAATLSKQSGASRTSPILRGIWISEVVLGEKLPRPPKDVPILPDEAPQGLTERQLIQRHTSDPSCARCHKRFDHFGFALEGFDAIGRARSEDASGLPIDTLAKVPGGGELNGMDGLRTYLLEQRRDDFLRQFCRKLLGYALGRSVQLSDQPLLDDLLDQLKLHDYRVSTAMERIVLSPQFREIRGREFDSSAARVK